jgi:hypothetical protein
MTSPKQIRAYAAQHGLDMTIENNGRCYSVFAWAPEGKIWNASQTHFLSFEGEGYQTTPDWRETMADLKRQLALGFEACELADCDVCQDA